MKASIGEKTLGGGRDLLSILLKANMSTNIPETQRLSDAEVISLCIEIRELGET
jgi:hypothetical protein